MPQNLQQFSFDFGGAPDLGNQELFLENIIIDRGSKYSVTYLPISNIESVKEEFKRLQTQKFYKKATHNSYAFRIKNESGAIQEGKNDDGETGAGMCILRELQRENFLGGMLIVTRYFGGIHLQNDRFKHVIDACKIFFSTKKEG